MQAPTPPAPPPIHPKGFFSGIQILPIVAGAVVDYIATFVGAVLYMGFFYMGDPEKSAGSEKAAEQAFQEMLAAPEGLLTMFLIGILGTVLGGYVAGRLAKNEEIKHGALVGAVGIILGLVQSSMTATSAVPPWYEFLGYVLMIPAGALGGSIAQGRAKSGAPNSSPGSRGAGF
jgi:putative membrane protein (TIGR04086 family)